MKLVELSASERSFRPIKFRERGLSLIVGDGEHVDGRQEGDSNGVGKTLALKLVHHCLGAAGSPPGLSNACPDWWFYLDVRVGGRIHRLARTGDGSKMSLDGVSIGLAALRAWLNEFGGLGEGAFTFRALFPRFARRLAEDSIDPLSVSKEQPHDSLIRTLYLLNLDDGLARKKAELKVGLDKLRAEGKLFKNSSVFREIMRAGRRPEARVKELEYEIARIRDGIDRFEVSEDYRLVEMEADRLTSELRLISEDISVKRFVLDGVREAQKRQVDISKEELVSLFGGLERILKPEVLRRFDEVEAFREALISNRHSRLVREELQLTGEIQDLERRSRQMAERRSILLQQLHGKRALDEYVSMSLRLVSLEEERARIQSYLDGGQEVERKVQEIRSTLVSQDDLALRYAQSRPVERLDGIYRSMVRALYPGASAGVSMRSNNRENKIRFDLDVFVQGQDSDGIGGAKILCFDLLAFRHGRRHGLEFLWHDNRLFADLDPKPRASWFSLVLDEFSDSGAQYIASINHENLVSMLAMLEQEERSLVEQCVVITLRGDKEPNKLMGFRFG